MQVRPLIQGSIVNVAPRDATELQRDSRAETEKKREAGAATQPEP